MISNGLKPSNFKEWLWSAKILTTIVWILLPIGYIVFIRILDIPSITYVAYGHGTLLDKFLGPIVFHLPNGVGNLLNIYMIYIPPIPLMTVLLVFSVYPAIYPTEKFFKNRGNANAVTEYQYIKKILFTFIIAEIIMIIALYSFISYTREDANNLLAQQENLNTTLYNLNTTRYNLGAQQENLNTTLYNLLAQQENPTATLSQMSNVAQQSSNVTQQINNTLQQMGNINEQQGLYINTINSLYVIIFALPAVLIFILLKLLLEHARQHFRFYYSQACFEIIKITRSETDKASYTIMGLEWYNKFVKRVTKGGIDIETIYSKILSLAQLSNNILLDTIVETFHNGDELKPMRHMLILLSYWKEGATLIKESLRTKIKESSDLLIPIVGVIITILSSFFLPKPGG